MFGGGWGLEGGGSSQEFDIATQIPESSSRSRSGSGGNTPRKTQPSRSEVVPRDTVVQKRKPFGSPASPKVRSPKNAQQSTTSTRNNDIVVTEIQSENNIPRNTDINKGRERGAFHAHNSSDILFKRSVQASSVAGIDQKKYQKKDKTGDYNNENENDGDNEEVRRINVGATTQDGKNADSEEDSPSTGDQSSAENSSETKWNDEDFALSVSVRTSDIPLKGCTFQRNGDKSDDIGKENAKKLNEEVGNEGGGVEEEKKLEKGVNEEGVGVGTEEGEGGGGGGEVGGLKSLRDDSQTVHKYVIALPQRFNETPLT